jgi:hypothetical protein
MVNALVNHDGSLISAQASCEHAAAHCLLGTLPNCRATLRWDRPGAKHSRTSASVSLGEILSRETASSKTDFSV